MDDADGPGKGHPRRKIGHIRADYDNYRWWNTAWPCHQELTTPSITAEIDRTYTALTAYDALRDLNALRPFSQSHPEAGVGSGWSGEFHLRLLGETCDFWVRLITRGKDDQLYLNAHAKAVDEREE